MVLFACARARTCLLKLITPEEFYSLLLQLNRDHDGHRGTVPIADNGSRQSELLCALNVISLHKERINDIIVCCINFAHRILSVGQSLS